MEKLVSFWSKNRVHVSRVYGEGLGNCVCGIVFNFLARILVRAFQSSRPVVLYI